MQRSGQKSKWMSFFVESTVSKNWNRSLQPSHSQSAHWISQNAKVWSRWKIIANVVTRNVICFQDISPAITKLDLCHIAWLNILIGQLLGIGSVKNEQKKLNFGRFEYFKLQPFRCFGLCQRTQSWRRLVVNIEHHPKCKYLKNIFKICFIFWQTFCEFCSKPCTVEVIESINKIWGN